MIYATDKKNWSTKNVVYELKSSNRQQGLALLQREFKEGSKWIQLKQQCSSERVEAGRRWVKRWESRNICCCAPPPASLSAQCSSSSFFGCSLSLQHFRHRWIQSALRVTADQCWPIIPPSSSTVIGNLSPLDRLGWGGVRKSLQKKLLMRVVPQ